MSGNHDDHDYTDPMGVLSFNSAKVAIRAVAFGDPEVLYNLTRFAFSLKHYGKIMAENVADPVTPEDALSADGDISRNSRADVEELLKFDPAAVCMRTRGDTGLLNELDEFATSLEDLVKEAGLVEPQDPTQVTEPQVPTQITAPSSSDAGTPGVPAAAGRRRPVSPLDDSSSEEELEPPPKKRKRKQKNSPKKKKKAALKRDPDGDRSDDESVQTYSASADKSPKQKKKKKAVKRDPDSDGDNSEEELVPPKPKNKKQNSVKTDKSTKKKKKKKAALTRERAALTVKRDPDSEEDSSGDESVPPEPHPDSLEAKLNQGRIPFSVGLTRKQLSVYRSKLGLLGKTGVCFLSNQQPPSEKTKNVSNVSHVILQVEATDFSFSQGRNFRYTMPNTEKFLAMASRLDPGNYQQQGIPVFLTDTGRPAPFRGKDSAYPSGRNAHYVGHYKCIGADDKIVLHWAFMSFDKKLSTAMKELAAQLR